MGYFVTSLGLSGGFGQIQGVEELKLFGGRGSWCSTTCRPRCPSRWAIWVCRGTGAWSRLRWR